MMFDVKIKIVTVNITLHISMDISIMFNITLRSLFTKPTGQWKSLPRIKGEKNACIKKAIFNFLAPELIVC